MRRLKKDRNRKIIKVEIPLTKHTGKIRIKKRNNLYEVGIPVATRRESFNEKMYVEWQISYYAMKNSKKAEMSTLNRDEFSFKSYNGKRKILYELSEFLYYFHKWNLISESDIKNLIEYISSIPKSNLIENLYQITKSFFAEKEINKLTFKEAKLEYPYLLYNFGNDFFAEIVIREKQKAIGVQPMFYLCFPITYLTDKNGKSLIGRTAKPNEVAYFEWNTNNFGVILDSFKIFGMLSENHRRDVLKILELILNL
jgi:hypothetical protein